MIYLHVFSTGIDQCHSIHTQINGYVVNGFDASKLSMFELLLLCRTQK